PLPEPRRLPAPAAARRARAPAPPDRRDGRRRLPRRPHAVLPLPLPIPGLAVPRDPRGGARRRPLPDRARGPGRLGALPLGPRPPPGGAGHPRRPRPGAPDLRVPRVSSAPLRVLGLAGARVRVAADGGLPRRRARASDRIPARLRAHAAPG